MTSTRPPTRYVSNPPTRVGKLARTQCSRCGSRTHIKRRETHPEKGTTFELQTFECGVCGMVDTNDVPTPGATS